MQIRCKECRHYQSRYADGFKTSLCKKHSLNNKKLQVKENFYCADAERKHGLIEADKKEKKMNDLGYGNCTTREHKALCATVDVSENLSQEKFEEIQANAEKIWKKAVDEFDKNFLSVGRD